MNVKETPVEKTNDGIIAFGMTRQEVIDAVGDIERECTCNDEDSSGCLEYSQSVKRGRDTLKQAGYYPYLPAAGV